MTPKLAVMAGGLLLAAIALPSGAFGEHRPPPERGDHRAAFARIVVSQSDSAGGSATTRGTAAPGSEITYTITLTNAGPSRLERAGVIDLLPRQLSDPHWTGSDGSSGNGPLVDMLHNLRSHETVTYTLSATIQPMATGSLTNIVVAGSAAGRGLPVFSFLTDTLQPESTLTLVDQPSVSTANVGADVSFEVTVKNSGPSAATALSVSNTLSPALTLTSATPSTGSFDATTGQWSVGTLPAGSTATLTVVTSLTATAGHVPALVSDAATAAASDASTVAASGNVAVNAALAVGIAASAGTRFDASSTTTSAQTNSPLAYQVVAENVGGIPATNVVVTVALPTSFSLDASSLTATAGSFTVSGDAITWTIPSLAADAAHLDYSVETGAAGGTAKTTVNITSDQTTDYGSATDLSQLTATSVITLSSVSDLSVTVSDGQSSVAAGSSLTYTIVAVNAGPSAASGLVITDTLPSGFTVTGETSSQASSFSQGAGSALWSGLSLESGQIATLTLTGTIDPSYSASVMVNKVSLPPPASTFDPDAYNNTATVTNTVDAQASLTVTNEAAQSNVPLGGSDTFTLAVTNSGPSDATGISVEDLVPSGLSLTSASASTGSYDQTSGVWTVAALAPDATATLTLVVTATSVNPAATDVATASASDATSVSSSATVDIASSDLSVTVSDGQSSVAAGSSLTYTIVAVNAGPSAASGLVITDTLPSGFTVTGETSSQASSFSQGAGSALWSGLSLESGQIATLTLTGTIDPSYSASVMVNKVSLPPPASTFDPDAYNNTATVTNTVDAQA